MTEDNESCLINALEGLTGAEVLHFFLDFHGTQLLTNEFAQHCVDEGKVDAETIGLAEDEEEDDV